MVKDFKKAEAMKDCPKCGGASGLLIPLKVADERIAVYGCKACGYTFNSEGSAYIDSPTHLEDVFKGATAGQETMFKMAAGKGMNEATKALLQAQVIEYGLQMWFDGLKQGLLLGVTQAERGKDGESGSSEGGFNTGA